MRQLQGQILAGIAVSVLFGSTALANRACCLPDGSCVMARVLEDCEALNGIVQPNDLTCETAVCGPQTPQCGDGIVDADEACDDGNDVDDDGCRNNCTVPVCGDGILDAGEICDDGNNDDGDGCSANCDEEQDLGMGCTPGYWQQRHHFDSWEVYSPTDSYSVTFGVTLARDYTLAESLGKGGGGAGALMRHSTAALLNSVNGGVDFAFTEAEVIAIVQDAFATGEYEAAKNLLEAQNEAGCPLD